MAAQGRECRADNYKIVLKPHTGITLIIALVVDFVMEWSCLEWWDEID